MGFVESFVSFADMHTDSPSLFKKMLAIALHGIFLGRKVVNPLAEGQMYHNILLLLVGDSAITRKTTIIAMADDLYHQTTLGTQFDGFASEQTPEALLEMMEKYEATPVVHIIDEYSKILFRLAQRRGYMNGYQSTICELYNCRNMSRGTKKGGTIYVIDPYYNFIGGIQPRVLMKCALEEDIRMGFYPRHLLVVANDEDCRFKPSSYLNSVIDQRQYKQLIEYLEILYKVLEQAPQEKIIIKLDDNALELYNKWQVALRERLRDMDLEGEFLKRYKDYIVKLADILAINKRPTLFFLNVQQNKPFFVTQDDIKDGIDIVEELFDRVCDFFEHRISWQQQEYAFTEISKYLKKYSFLPEKCTLEHMARLLRIDINTLASMMEELKAQQKITSKTATFEGKEIEHWVWIYKREKFKT